jgi:restriction endonuclease
MEFKFDAAQEHQIDAIAAACGLLDGQPYVRSQLVAPKGASFQAIANRLDLEESAILANLHEVQSKRGIKPDAKLETIAAEIETVSGKTQARFWNFSVEMETGTGKTYVYLRTAHELFRSFGLRKFIVVVPSIAVREGVLKTLRVTEKHLKELYGNPPYRFCVYDSANLSQVLRRTRTHGDDDRCVRTRRKRHHGRHRPSARRQAHPPDPGGAARAHSRRAAEYGEREPGAGASRARPPVRAALQRHPPQPL